MGLALFALALIQGTLRDSRGASWKASVCVHLCRREPWRAGRREDRLYWGPTMVVTQLSLEFRFQGKKLRGFSCELTRSPHGVLPESVPTTTCQVAIPILLSGLGMMTAGLVMNNVQVCTGPREGAQTGWRAGTRALPVGVRSELRSTTGSASEKIPWAPSILTVTAVTLDSPERQPL